MDPTCCIRIQYTSQMFIFVNVIRVPVVWIDVHVYPRQLCLFWEGSTTVDCTLHCRLAKIRGLMYGGKYSAVIGRETRFLYAPTMNMQAMGISKPIRALCLPLYIKPRNFAKRHRQCKLERLTPPTIPISISPRPPRPASAS